jgi:hypothetical protein
MSGVAAADHQGGRGAVQFRNGVVIYQGAEAGLMASINIELNYIRYEPMGADSSLQPWIDKTWRPGEIELVE